MGKRYLDGREAYKKVYWRVTKSTTLKELIEKGGTKVIVDPKTFVSDCLDLNFITVPGDMANIILDTIAKQVEGISGLAFSIDVFSGEDAGTDRVTFIYWDRDGHEFYHITATEK